jgi:putative phosphoesterase
MKFAIIGDIHSNKYALKSVLDDIQRKNVDFILSTGDLVGYLTHPNEVIEMLRKHNVLSIMGNHDQRLANASPISIKKIKSMTSDEVFSKGSLAFNSLEITSDNRMYLKNLPLQLKLSLNGFELLLVHGSPSKIDEYLYPDSEELIEFSQNIDENIIISGHTHLPYHLIKNDKHFINPGSVGKPKDRRYEATYMILDITNEIRSNIVQVDYPIDELIKAIKKNPFISNDLIDHLKEGY